MILMETERRQVKAAYMKLPVIHSFRAQRDGGNKVTSEGQSKILEALLGTYRRVDITIDKYNRYDGKEDAQALDPYRGFSTIYQGQNERIEQTLELLMDRKPEWCTDKQYAIFVGFVERTIARRVSLTEKPIKQVTESTNRNETSFNKEYSSIINAGSQKERAAREREQYFIQLATEYLKEQVISESRWKNLSGKNDIDKVFNWLKERKEKNSKKLK